MWMTEGEIRQSYRLAKNPNKQIGVLAELNDVDKEKVWEMVRDIAPKGADISRPYRRSTWTHEMEVKLAALRRQRISCPKIAEELGLTKDQIYGKVAKLNNRGVYI